MKFYQRPCRFCGQPSTVLCDAPRGKRTCDAPCCAACATVVHGNQHRCPECAAARRRLQPDVTKDRFFIRRQTVVRTAGQMWVVVPELVEVAG